MTPQERDLLTNLVTRLRQSPSQAPDQEALTMINDLVRDKPDTPYVLAQTVLIQDYALHQAQARIAELEQQVKAQDAPKEGGFLSSIFGSGKAPQPAPRPQPQAYQPQQSYQPQPAYQPQPTYAQPAAGPWGQAPVGAAPQMFAQQSGAPSFLRSAATTAAGVAGGALLFEGIRNMMGGHGNAMASPLMTPDPSPLMPPPDDYQPNQFSSADLAQDDGAADDYDTTDDNSGFDDGGSEDI